MKRTSRGGLASCLPAAAGCRRATVDGKRATAALLRDGAGVQDEWWSGSRRPAEHRAGGIQTRLVACCSPGPCPASAYALRRRQACPCRRRAVARRCTLLRARAAALACCLPVTAAARRRQLEIPQITCQFTLGMGERGRGGVMPSSGRGLLSLVGPGEGGDILPFWIFGPAGYNRLLSLVGPPVGDKKH